MFEAFHQAKKRSYILANAIDPKVPVDYESLAGQAKRNREHVENAKKLYEEKRKK
jgi:hypothetical protein